MEAIGLAILLVGYMIFVAGMFWSDPYIFIESGWLKFLKGFGVGLVILGYCMMLYGVIH